MPPAAWDGSTSITRALSLMKHGPDGHANEGTCGADGRAGLRCSRGVERGGEHLVIGMHVRSGEGAFLFDHRGLLYEHPNESNPAHADADEHAFGAEGLAEQAEGSRLKRYMEFCMCTRYRWGATWPA